MVAQVSHRAPSGRFIRGYLLTWGLLAAGGLVYLASLAWHPDLFTPSQQTTQPDPSLQAANKALAEIGTVRRTPTLRLGVTGLAGAGKTVFITALVHNLAAGGRLPFLAAQAEGRLLRAWLEPQPDDALPRFDYEAHCAALAANPPRWPESTRRISELRIVRNTCLATG